MYLCVMICVSRKEHFNAAHKLYNPNWTKERNAEVFGPCANENWHGHNFELIVTVKGYPDIDTGFVIDLKKLSQLIKIEILDKVDHKNLNLDVPFLKGQMASCENLIIAFWGLLVLKIKEIAPKADLHHIRLYETPRNFVDYYGD
jgi:6-pyruvoyltetrahydropterin/6-carboxytetrahydropterin synthase